MRDVKAYMSSCGSALRQVPVGLDLADITPRADWVEYFDCTIGNDANTRADWIGFNPYVECDPLGHTKYAQSTGLQALMKEYKAIGYSRILMFGEFGCNLGKNTIDDFPNQRAFNDVSLV